MSEIGWREQSLGDIADIVIGRTPPRKEPAYWTDDLSYPFCSIADMTGREVRPSREGVTERAIAEGKAKLVPAGSLMMSFKLTIGRVGFAACDLYPNEAIAWMSPHNPAQLDVRYLGTWLSAMDFDSYGGQAVKGRTLNKESLSSLPIAFPDIAEQRRIADIATAFDLSLEAARMYADRSASLLAAMRDELLKEAPLRPLSELLLRLDNGASPRCEDRQPLPDEWGVLKTSAVDVHGFRPGEAKVLPEGFPIREQHRVREGDILLTRASGSPTRVGVPCLVDTDPGRLLLSDLIFRITPDPDEVSAEYLTQALLDTRVREQVRARMVGSASMKKVNLGILRSLMVPVLDPNAQAVATPVIADFIAAARAANGIEARTVALRAGVLREIFGSRLSVPASYDRFLRDADADDALATLEAA